MEKAILGRKLGMTSIFDETGLSIPVTVVEAGPMKVVRKKTPERDGYSAVLVSFEEAGKHQNKKASSLGLRCPGWGAPYLFLFLLFISLHSSLSPKV